MDNVSGSNNFWYYSGQSPSDAVPPGWSQRSSTEDPKILFDNDRVILEKDSPLAEAVEYNQVYDMSEEFVSNLVDIYGVPRPRFGSAGPVEPVLPRPNPPRAIGVQ